MKEIINNIKKAEAQAEKIIADARAEANKISNESEAEILAIDAQLVEEIKNAKKSVSLKCEAEAQELYAKRLEFAKKEGDALRQSALKNLDFTADFIVKKVLG